LFVFVWARSQPLAPQAVITARAAAHLAPQAQPELLARRVPLEHRLPLLEHPPLLVQLVVPVQAPEPA
jgi:hypothetical protein